MIESSMEFEEKGNKVISIGKIKEVLDRKEFVQHYYRKLGMTQQLKSQIIQKKNELQSVMNARDDEETRKLKDLLVEAEKLKRKEELAKELPEMERNYEDIKKDVDQMKQLAEKIMKEEEQK